MDHASLCWDDTVCWAREEFGHTALGDRRRTSRLVSMAAAVGARPAGKVTQVFTVDAERQGAYGLLGNEDVSADALALGAHQACARRCSHAPFAYVPLDDSSVRVTDRKRAKGTGQIGSSVAAARGFKVMSALGVTPDGVPQGVCGQRFWARNRTRVQARAKATRGLSKEQRRKAKRRLKAQQNRRRRFEDKEPYRWIEVGTQVHSVFASHAPTCRPWLQCDRGADKQDVLVAMLQRQWLFTVRASYDRCLESGQKLWAHLQNQPRLGTYRLEVPSRKGQPARLATMAVRAAPVRLCLRSKATGQERTAEVWAVWAQEVGVRPRGCAQIEWMLLTSAEVTTLTEAQEVLLGYATRWRVEEMHRTWKSGGCHVEDTELHEPERILKWASLLCSVAMRIARLTYLARTQPDVPADTELSRDELDATIALKKPPGWGLGETPTLGEAVRWLADLGGYTGQSSGGPPGQTVIGRGLKRVESAAAAFKTLRELGIPLVPEK
jgi:hypothetical protein